MNGLFITFEGPDGSGKSTQIEKLADVLKKKGFSCIKTHEPGGTVISNHIRALLLDPSHTEMSAQTEALLYAASRAQHVREKIIPALRAGNIVLCDRFIDASVAYQGIGLGLGVDQIKKINDFAADGLVPARSYLIDLSPEIGRKRLLVREKGDRPELDRIEQKQLSYHQRVREAFHMLYEQNQERICWLDGEESIEDVSAKIIADFERLWMRFQKMKEV